MKKIIKITALLIAALMVTALLAACGETGTKTDETTKAEDSAVKLAILDTAYTEEDYAIGVSKDNKALLAAVDECLKTLQSYGGVSMILDKYISVEGKTSDANTQFDDLPAYEGDAFTTVVEGELHMATNAAFPPYENTTDDGGYEGIDIEIAQNIAKMLGLKLVVDDMDFDAVITSVQQGKSDIAMAGLTVTDERKESIDFTVSYATGIQSVIVKDGGNVKSLDDLANVKIGCQKGTTGYFYCCDDFGEENVTAYDNGASAVQALVSGKIDAVVIDNAPALEFVNANNG